VTLALNAFKLTEISWYPDHPRWEGRVEVYDQNWDRVVVAGVDPVHNLAEAATFEGFWKLVTRGLPLPETVREPDFAKVLDLTRSALSIGCLWSADCWDGEWWAECIDEVRGKYVTVIHEAATLEEAIGMAVGDALSRKSLLEDARETWDRPVEEWLAKAMDLAANAPDLLGPELITPATVSRP